MATSTAPRRDTVHPRRHPPQPTPAGQPLRAVLDLGAVPTAPGCARAWTRAVLREWRLAGLSEASRADSLRADHQRAARLPPARARPPSVLALTFDRGELAILVRDFCPGTPQPRDAGTCDESGRGLLLVESMSNRVGWYVPEDGTPGKVVWAVIVSSAAAQAKASGQHDPAGQPYRSFRGLMEHLATLTRNQVRYPAPTSPSRCSPSRPAPSGRPSSSSAPRSH